MKKQDWLYPRSPGFSAIVLSVLYLVGALGIPSSVLGPVLLPLSPLQLLLTVSTLIFFQPEKSLRFWAVSLFVFMASIAVEIAGVSTGLIFGAYFYGDSLGPKVWDVPIIIGVNWVLLVIGTAMVSEKLSSNRWLRSVIGASIMVSLDLLIEPLSGYLDFWHWEGNEIPLQNYLAWWLIAFSFQLIFQFVYSARKRPSASNPIALPVITLQFLFFLLIHLLT